MSGLRQNCFDLIISIKLSKHCHLKERMMLRYQTSQAAYMEICEDTGAMLYED